MYSSPYSRYSSVAQLFHWLTAILVLVAFVFGLGGSEERVYLPSRDFERHLHETLGMAVLLVSLLRMVWRLFDAKPAAPDMPRWMEVASKSVQGILYLLLLAVPLTAIFGAWLEGHMVVLLGGIDIGSPVAQSHARGVWVSELHTWLGDLILWVAGAHACAAIYHHHILKDRTLVMMLPQWLEKRLTARQSRH